jgi:hypothetical protein
MDVLPVSMMRSTPLADRSAGELSTARFVVDGSVVGTHGYVCVATTVLLAGGRSTFCLNLHD